MPQTVTEISVQQAWETLRQGQPCQVIDVREPSEYGTEHIAGSTSMPLSTLDGQRASAVDREKTIFLLCKAGGRARKAADIFAALGAQNLAVIDGGLQAWIAAGYPVEKGTNKVWSIDRQVHFTAGALIFAGIILGTLASNIWLLLSLFVSFGLMFSAVTNSCTLAMLLARMPWNKQVGG